MTKHVIGGLEGEIELDPESRLNYSLNFLLAYFDANVYCGFLTEKEAEDAMGIVCMELDEYDA